MYQTVKRMFSFLTRGQRLKNFVCSPVFVFDNKQSSNSFHQESHKIFFSHLKSRGVVRLHGKDSADFLQGLVTNDVHELLQQPASVQYSFMLNVQGRVLYDLFLYNLTTKGESPTLFVDVPLCITEEFITLLRRYKLRKKVDISNVSNEYQIWSQFSSTTEGITESVLDPSLTCSVICCPDPRVPAFGIRLIRKDSNEILDAADEQVYRECRYQWGIPEGVDDLPIGSCFPLESNAIFMNGVNFQKGCYIGQELTARTHHTGVTRKRLMPLVFQRSPPEIDTEASIKTDKGRNAGKFRRSQGKYGLGLVRLAYMKENLSLTAQDQSQVSLTTHLPHWWPKIDS